MTGRTPERRFLSQRADGPDTTVPPLRDPRAVVDAQDLVEAVVAAFINGDAATRQHIVDTLGDRAQGSP